VNLSINPFASESAPRNFSASDVAASSPVGPGAVLCPSCLGDIPLDTGWRSCPYCAKPLQILAWPAVRQKPIASNPLSDQSACFFHPDKPFHACCKRCGRFMCGLCDLQLGAEHVCPVCFERGRTNSGVEAGQAEWRNRDVLYDSVALTLGWAWIVVWPSIVAAIPATIFLHVRHRKAPRSYLMSRSGWRFWVAYLGLLWLPLLVAIVFATRWLERRH
jgi:hypothetical protein